MSPSPHKPGSHPLSDPPPLRLVHVTTVALTLRFLRGQGAFFARRGFALSAVTAPGELAEGFARQEGIPVHTVAMQRRITPLADLVALARLWRLLRRLRPHIVCSHTPKGGLLGMLAATLARVPVRIYHLRGLPLATARGLTRLLLAAAERTSCRLAHRVLCVSPSLADDAVAAGLCRRGKITVPADGSGQGVDAAGRFDPARLPPGAAVDLRRRWRIPDGAPVIGFVGRLVKDKGIVELAAAWRELRDRFPAAHLVLVGPEEPRDPVPPEVLAELHGDPRVRLAGFVDDAAACYAVFDLVAFPSHREGFPNVPLEAAAMELPLVAARATGSVDAVVDGETGTLVPVGDAAALAAALASYLEQPELARRHGGAGRRRALERYRPQRIWGELADFYRQLAGERGLPLPEVDSEPAEVEPRVAGETAEADRRAAAPGVPR